MSTRPSVAPVSARRRGASALGRGVMLMQGLAGTAGSEGEPMPETAARLLRLLVADHMRLLYFAKGISGGGGTLAL